MIFALPAFLMIFTNPLTAFGDAGTLAAFGFLVAYYLITLAAPMYLKRIGELERKHVVLAAVAVVALLVPTIGSFYPRPAWPVDLFPFIFMAYMAVGAVWLFVVHHRQPETLAGIQADLDRAPELIEEESIEIGEVTAAAGHGLTASPARPPAGRRGRGPAPQMKSAMPSHPVGGGARRQNCSGTRPSIRAVNAWSCSSGGICEV